MKKTVELPVAEPVYKTFHYQGNAGAVLYGNPSIRNWYLNQVMILRCNRRFLYGFMSPEVTINDSSFVENPYYEQIWIPMKYLDQYVHPVIQNLLDDGYYVAFDGIDDYYVKGKSWYDERHFYHDGLICGYDQVEKTYSIFAYDQSWLYRVFKTPQKGFEAGRKEVFQYGVCGSIWGLKAKSGNVELNPSEICEKMKEYLDSSLDKYPVHIDDLVYGTAVHDYIIMYVDKLADGSIPYERLDRRVFRMLWEHKKIMCERIAATEDKLGFDNDISRNYGNLVKEADNMRMLYALHHMKRRDSVLPTLRNKVIKLKKEEENLLTKFVEKTERELKI